MCPANVLKVPYGNSSFVDERLRFLEQEIKKDLGLSLPQVLAKMNPPSKLSPLEKLNLVSEMWMSYPTSSW